jgi:hypothetical protein
MGLEPVYSYLQYTDALAWLQSAQQVKSSVPDRGCTSKLKDINLWPVEGITK